MSRRARETKTKASYSSFRPPTSAYDSAHVAQPSEKEKSPRPYFSFRHICQKDFCAKKMPHEKMKAYAEKLRILSELEWSAIDVSPKETNGFEMIPTSQLNATLPKPFETHKAVWVFRFGGSSYSSRTGGRIAGIKNEDKFYVLFIDRDYSLYDHG